MICHECNNNERRVESFIQFNKKLCNECKKLDKYNLITKQTIKEKYLLKETDFW